MAPFTARQKPLIRPHAEVASRPPAQPKPPSIVSVGHRVTNFPSWTWSPPNGKFIAMPCQSTIKNRFATDRNPRAFAQTLAGNSGTLRPCCHRPPHAKPARCPNPLLIVLLAAFVVIVGAASSPAQPLNPKTGLAVTTNPPGQAPVTVQNSMWNGCPQEEFVLADHKCRLVKPNHPAAGHPWVWRPEFFGAFDQADRAMLKQGFALAYMDMNNIFGSPAAMELMDKFYDCLTTNHSLSARTTLFGFSRGGLYALNWSARHPERVACLYLDAPVCDFKSWPAGFGKGLGSPADWTRLKKFYGFPDDQAARDYRLNPIDNLKPLADAKIPILSVCGDADKTVPYPENTAILKARYEALGGSIQVILKPGCDHHPHSLTDPQPIVDFVLKYN